MSTLVFWATEMRATKGASLMCCLRKVDDPRKPSNGTRHDFVEILVIAMAAALSECDTVEDIIACWAQKKEGWLGQFLPLKNGVASEKTFLRIFRALEPKPFEVAFRRWVAQVVGGLAGGIAVDGKTVRGSGSGGERAIHMVSAFATEPGVVLGQEKVGAKSNEITAIPELLQAQQIKGLLVTLDAMRCPRNLARQITDQGGDYLLAVKGNQAALLEGIQTDFMDQCQSEAVDRQRQVHQSRGRVVGQIASVLPEKEPLTGPIGPRAKRSVWSTPCARPATKSRTSSGAITSALAS